MMSGMPLFSSSTKMELLGWKRSSWLHRREIEAQVRELQVENQILQYWSSRDALTGIANRHQLELVLDHQWRCAIIGSAPLSLLMIAVDRFREYTDTLGQQAAENCLKQVACSLSTTLSRPGALVGRYRDEQFLAILPRTSLEVATSVSKMLRITVEGWRIPHPHSAIGSFVTISVGVASTLPRTDSKPSPLIDEAGQALSHAQQRGGNRIFTAASPPLPTAHLL
jgi:diguanylate cyclase (GGDEF)-like protein